MYNTVKNVILRGDFELSRASSRINTLWIEGNLSDTQRDELISLARSEAKAENEIDVFAKLTELDERLRALECKESESGVSEYIAGKWYYRGDKAIYGGVEYTCIAPEGAVCTWSPSEYPSYWEC